jgi:hypothetical protein
MSRKNMPAFVDTMKNRDYILETECKERKTRHG